MAAPLLFPKSSTSAETQVASTRASAPEAASARGVEIGRPRLILADFLATTTTAAAPRAKPKASTTRVTTRRASRPASTSRTTAKPKPTATAAARPAAAKPAVAPGPPSQTGNSQTGKASWYNAPAGTCAHRTLPKGLVVTVTNVANGKQVSCRVADRGPYIDGRIIDLSRSGFEAIAPISAGVVSVRVDW